MRPIASARFSPQSSEDLLELYAQNVTLRVVPSTGVFATHSLNGYPTVAHDRGFSVLCGDIVANDERSVLIESSASRAQACISLLA